MFFLLALSRLNPKYLSTRMQTCEQKKCDLAWPKHILFRRWKCDRFFFWSSFISICSAGEIVSFPFSVYCFFIVSRWLSEYARKVSEMWWSFFLFFNNWCLSIKYYYHLTDIPSIFAIYVFLFFFSFLSLSILCYSQQQNSSMFRRFSFWLDTLSIMAMLFAKHFSIFYHFVIGPNCLSFPSYEKDMYKNLHTLFRYSLTWHLWDDIKKDSEEYDDCQWHCWRYGIRNADQIDAKEKQNTNCTGRKCWKRNKNSEK